MFLQLTQQAIVTLVILTAAIVLFVTNRLRADLVALLVLAGLAVTGVLTPQEAFAGFSRSAVVTIVAIFVLAQGLFLTGASTRVGDGLARVAGGSEARLALAVMLAGAFLSLIMNNIAAASVLMPAVSSAAHRKGVNPSRLLMPLAFATILGGMATLFTTVNIIASGILREHDQPGFGVLDFAPVGLPAAAAGIAYMVVVGRRALPARSPVERLADGLEPGEDLADLYGLGEQLFRARIPPGSYLDGNPIARSTFREIYDLDIVALEHNGRTILAPAPETVLRSGDIVTLQGNLEEFRRRDVEPYLEIQPARSFRERDLESEDVVMAEIVLTPRSGLISKTLREVNFREKYGYVALAIWREGQAIRHDLAGLPLQFGDALLVQGPRAGLRVLRAERDLILLSDEAEVPPIARPQKMGLATAIMSATLLVAVSGLLPTAEAMLAGGLVMVMAGCVTMDEAYAAIDWKAVFVVAGMLSMGLALTKTGLAGLLASGLTAALGGYGPFALLAGLTGLAALLTQVLGGPAVAALLVPLAIQAAGQLGVDPRSLAMGVALATSLAFVTPIGHSVNVLVMGPGGYSFRDYFKVGLPLTLLVIAVILLVLPVFWPL
jgi:di/tricarboxylate transporter